MKSVTIIVIMLTLILPVICTATDNLFDDVVANLVSDRPFNSPDIIKSLRHLSSQAERSEDRLTAQITLVLYLLDRDSTDLSTSDMAEPFQLCQEVIKASPDTWQAQLAKFYLALEPSYSGDSVHMVLRIQEADSLINYGLLDGSSHPALMAAKRIYTKGVDTSWREVLLFAKAVALCESNQIDEAENILSSLTSVEYKMEIQNRIELERSVQLKRQVH
ncbi:MAG TPA: hypothetical protein PKH33_18310 [bacterium]|jgi:hypothetical protein|nr:MAG: hypothetical protein BWX54_01521 [Verrucomicrobia bacterium ADurb.Bin018]HOC94310.1 hypothetical protein [bacterium]